MKKPIILINTIIILSIAVFAAIQEVKSDYIKLSIAEVHQLSMDSTIYISRGLIEKGASIISLDSEGTSSINEFKEQAITIIPIRASDILQRQNRKTLNKLKGDIILQSEDMYILCSTWLTLTQLGHQSVKILIEEDSEILEYKFQPDQIARLK